MGMGLPPFPARPHPRLPLQGVPCGAWAPHGRVRAATGTGGWPGQGLAGHEEVLGVLQGSSGRALGIVPGPLWKPPGVSTSISSRTHRRLSTRIVLGMHQDRTRMAPGSPLVAHQD